MAQSINPYDADLQNGIRLASLLLQMGTKTIKSNFDLKVQQQRGLPHILTRQKVLIDNYRWGRQGTRRLLNKDQYDLLYPNGKATQDSEKFDLTLLILLYSILGIIPPPVSKIWHKRPSANDFSEAADLVRLRLMRNTLYGHISSMKMSEEEFNVHWLELTSVLKRLGASPRECDDYKHQSLDPEEVSYVRAQIFLSTEQDISDFQSICENIFKQWSSDIGLMTGRMEGHLQNMLQKFEQNITKCLPQREFADCANSLRRMCDNEEVRNIVYKSVANNVRSIQTDIGGIKKTLESCQSSITEMQFTQNTMCQSQSEIQKHLLNTNKTEATHAEKITIYSDVRRSDELFHQLTQCRDALKILIVNEKQEDTTESLFQELGKAIGFVPWNIVIDLDYNSKICGLYDPVTQSFRKHSHFRPITYKETDSVSDAELSAIANGEKAIWISANGCSEAKCQSILDKFGKSKIPITTLLNSITKKITIPKAVLCMTLQQSAKADGPMQKLVDMVTEVIQSADDIISEKHSAFIFVRTQENYPQLTKTCSNARHISVFCMEMSLAKTLHDLYPTSHHDVKYYFPCRDGNLAYITKEMWTPYEPFAQLFHTKIGSIDFATMNQKEADKEIKKIKEAYHKGNVITVEAMHINSISQIYVERKEIAQVTDTIKKKISPQNWADIRKHPLIIRHDPSGGGSTVARVALYQMRSEYPCVLVKVFGEELYTGLSEIHRHSGLPVIVLVDDMDTTASELRTFRKRLENDQSRVLVILTEQLTKPVVEGDRQFLDQNSSLWNTDRPLYVSNTLAPEDVSGFGSLFEKYGVKIQMPKVFPYGLQAFLENHQRFYSHITTCYQNINLNQKLFLRFTCMVWRYSRFTPNIKMAMKILGASADETCGDNIYDVLGYVSDLTVCDNKFIKPANICVVDPIMTEACGKEDKAEHLRQFTKDMEEVLKKCTEQEDKEVACNLVHCVFIKRSKGIDKWWSPFLFDIYRQLTQVEVDETLNTLINILKETKVQLHIRSLYARYLMYQQPANYNKSVEQSKIAIGIKNGQTVSDSKETDAALLSTYGNLLRERAHRTKTTESFDKLCEDIKEAVLAHRKAQDSTRSGDVIHNHSRSQYNSISFMGEAKSRYLMLTILLARVCGNKKPQLRDFLKDTNDNFLQSCESEALRSLDDMEHLRSLDLLYDDDPDVTTQMANRLKFQLLYLHSDKKQEENVAFVIQRLPEMVSCDIGFLVRSSNHQNFKRWCQLTKQELQFIFREIHRRIFVAEYTLRSNFEDIILSMIYLRCGFQESTNEASEEDGSLDYAINCAKHWKLKFKKDYNAYFMYGILIFVQSLDTENEELMREAVASLKSCTSICTQHKATHAYRKLRYFIGKGEGLARVKPRPEAGNNIPEDVLEVFTGRQIRNDKVNVRPFPSILEAGVKWGKNPKFSDLHKQQQLFRFNLSFAHDSMWTLNMNQIVEQDMSS